MGLDVSFNKELAINAGLITTIMTNGTAEEIEQAKLDPDCVDHYYIAWLEQEHLHIQVPGCEPVIYVDATDDCDGNLIVRANKWGRVYGPLTEWLLENKIEWMEF